MHLDRLGPAEPGGLQGSGGGLQGFGGGLQGSGGGLQGSGGGLRGSGGGLQGSGGGLQGFGGGLQGSGLSPASADLAGVLSSVEINVFILRCFCLLFLTLSER
ncbi:uncharacterized protein V6R79_011885 [Siganus canaliculatus]